MKATLKVEGFKELDEALGDLKKATARNILRRAGREILQPIADDYAENVDRLTGQLHDSITVGTRLSPRQAALARREGGKSFAEVYVGAGPDPAAHLEEFGSVNNRPNPALRNAWDRGWRGALESLTQAIREEIDKAVARAARKAARDAAKIKAGR